MAGELDTYDVRRTVTEGLAPYVGANMASASVNGHLDKLGVTSTLIAADEVETLLSWLGPGLSVFVGPARGAQVIDEIREKLGIVGGGE